MQPEYFQNVVRDIVTSQLPPQTIALWWLGQASVVLRSTDTTIYIDPFFSPYPNRLIPPPFDPTRAAPADYVLCTHEHNDHFDPKTLAGLAQSSPQARFVAPSHMREQVVAATGVAAEHIIGMQPGEELDWGNVKLFPVAAVHGLTAPPATYDFGFIEQGKKRLYRYLGYVLEIAGVRIYHAGDTLVYDGLSERLRELKIDIALLPINGRSYMREQRNLIGNMDEREAADLAAATNVKVLIPIHYDMFAANLGRPGVLIDYVRTTYPDISCILPGYGQRITYSK